MKSPQTLEEELDRCHENGKWFEHQARSWAGIFNHIFVTTPNPVGWFERMASVEEGQLGYYVLLKYRKKQQSEWIVFRGVWGCVQSRKIAAALISDSELLVTWCLVRGKGSNPLAEF